MHPLTPPTKHSHWTVKTNSNAVRVNHDCLVSVHFFPAMVAWSTDSSGPPRARDHPTAAFCNVCMTKPPSRVNSAGRKVTTGTFGPCCVAGEVLAVLWWLGVGEWGGGGFVTLHCHYQNDSALSCSNKMALITAHLNAESFWWWQRNVTPTPHPTASTSLVTWNNPKVSLKFRDSMSCKSPCSFILSCGTNLSLAGIVVNMLLWLGLKCSDIFPRRPHVRRKC